MPDGRSAAYVLYATGALLIIAILYSTVPGISVSPTLIADLAVQKECAEASVLVAKKEKPRPARRQGLTMNQGEKKYAAVKAATTGLIEYLCAAMDSPAGSDHKKQIAQRTRDLKIAADQFSDWVRDYVEAQNRPRRRNSATGQECCASANGGSPLPDLASTCVELLKIAVEESRKAKEETKRSLRSCKLCNWDEIVPDQDRRRPPQN